jgi:hypothetical protein
MNRQPKRRAPLLHCDADPCSDLAVFEYTRHAVPGMVLPVIGCVVRFKLCARHSREHELNEPDIGAVRRYNPKRKAKR